MKKEHVAIDASPVRRLIASQFPSKLTSKRIYLETRQEELFEPMTIRHATGTLLHELRIYFISPSKIFEGREV